MVHSNSSPARPISRSLRSIRFLPDPQWNPSAKVAGAACPQLITSIFSGRCGRCLASAPVVAILARSTRPRLKRPLVVCNVARHEEMCEIPRTTLDTHTHTQSMALLLSPGSAILLKPDQGQSSEKNQSTWSGS